MLEDNQNKSRVPEFELGAPAEIKALVRRFRVCWEVYPLQILATEGIRKIGFDLELLGTPECGTEHISPGCQHCQRVETALQEIAQRIMMRESPSCTHIVSPDGATLSYASVRANRPDVVVRVFMAHRHEWDQPADECMERCLKEIEQALTELGACKGGWTEAQDESGGAGRSQRSGV
jgi:hypothetical protein